MTTIRKRYCDTSLGQVHLRELAADGPETNPPLLLLHPAPSSGLYFTTVMPLLNRGRRVIAPDYPGYGGSASLAESPSIASYATAMRETVAALDLEKTDVLGFHTGCLVAVEMALETPESLRRILLCDVPYFTGETQVNLRGKMTKPMPIGRRITCLESPWQFNVENRIDTVPLPRAFELFAEHLRAGTHDYFGFAAAFSYDCESQFAALTGDVVVLATQSGLLEPSRIAAGVIPGAELIEVPEVTTAVFEAGAEAISQRITEALDV